MARNLINLRVGTSVFERRALAGVEAAATYGEGKLVDILAIPPLRSGRHYSGNPNASSAPGEAPAPQTGLYRQGIAHTPATVIGRRVEALIASRGVQAAALELGTERMAPRPHVSLLRDDPGLRAGMRKAFEIGARRAR